MALAMSQKSSRYLFAAMGLTKRLGFSCPGRSCMHALLPSAGQTSCCQGWQRRQHLHVDHYSPVAPFIEFIHSYIARLLHLYTSPFFGSPFCLLTIGEATGIPNSSSFEEIPEKLPQLDVSSLCLLAPCWCCCCYCA